MCPVFGHGSTSLEYWLRLRCSISTATPRSVRKVKSQQTNSFVNMTSVIIHHGGDSLSSQNEADVSSFGTLKAR